MGKSLETDWIMDLVAKELSQFPKICFMQCSSLGIVEVVTF